MEIKMKALNKLLIAVSLMLASTSSFSAMHDFGDLSGGAVESSVIAHMPGSFTDTFSFTLSDANNSLGVASENFFWSFLGADLLDISDFNVELLDGTSSLGDWSGFGPFSYDLTAGSYSLEVTGQATGIFGGSYALSASAVSPVPEASTLSLMFAGFGLVGFMSYRRRNMI